MNEYMKHLIGGGASLLALFPVTQLPQIQTANEARSDLEALNGDMARIGGDFNRSVAKVMHVKPEKSI